MKWSLSQDTFVHSVKDLVILQITMECLHIFISLYTCCETKSDMNGSYWNSSLTPVHTQVVRSLLEKRGLEKEVKCENELIIIF